MRPTLQGDLECSEHTVSQSGFVLSSSSGFSIPQWEEVFLQGPPKTVPRRDHVFSLRFQLGMQTQHGILSCTSSDRLSSGASQVPAFHQTPSQAHNETMQANGFSLPSRLDVRGFLLTLWDLPRDSTQTASHQRCRNWDAYWGLDQVTWRVCSWNTDAPSMTPHEVLFPRGARSPLFSGKIPKRG